DDLPHPLGDRGAVREAIVPDLRQGAVVEVQNDVSCHDLGPAGMQTDQCDRSLPHTLGAAVDDQLVTHRLNAGEETCLRSARLALNRDPSLAHVVADAVPSHLRDVQQLAEPTLAASI